MSVPPVSFFTLVHEYPCNRRMETSNLRTVHLHPEAAHRRRVIEIGAASVFSHVPSYPDSTHEPDQTCSARTEPDGWRITQLPGFRPDCAFCTACLPTRRRS